MNLNKIFEIQKKLDIAIHKKANVTSEEVYHNKIIALYVEIGEFANEIATFKYWKLNKNVNKDKVLEEYVDIMHFFISIYVQLDVNIDVKHAKIYDTNKMILDLFKSLSILDEELKIENLNKAFSLFLGIGDSLKFNWREVENSYLKKNEINYQRIKDNY